MTRLVDALEARAETGDVALPEGAAMIRGCMPGSRRVRRRIARVLQTKPTLWKRMLRWFLDGVW